MFNYILNSVRSITVEIAKLEDLSIQMQKTHDCERKRQYEEFLKWLKRERKDLLDKYNPITIIDEIKFSREVDKDDDERVMAKLYYIEGKSWKDAYYGTEEYLDFEDEKFDDIEAEKIIKNKCDNHQRNIERKVNVFNSFNKKK